MSDKPKAVIWDLDGTLCTTNTWEDRQVEIARGDWSWFERIAKDAEAIKPTMRILWDMIDAHNTLHIESIIVTARQEIFRETTRHWLAQHGIYDDNTLIMRPPEMNGWMDWQYKLAMYQEIIKDYDVIAAYEDKPEICRLWELLGIETVIKVSHNNKLSQSKEEST